MYQVNGLYTITVNGVQQFQPANPGAGVPNGTQITANFMNDVQGELLNFLAAANIAPLVNTPTQVKQSTDFLYGLKFKVLSAPKVIAAADRGTIFQCNPGTATVDLPIASDFDTGFTVGFAGGSSATTFSLLTILNSGGALQGKSGFDLGPGGFILLQAQGLNWGVLSASPDVETAGARPYYVANQGASITPAVNTSYAIASQVVTFPSFSPSGAFRVLFRLVGKGAVSAANSSQNFTGSVTDGTNVETGAPWLVAGVVAGANTWGTSDTILSSATYLPGTTATFDYSIATAGGSTSFTINGSQMIITVEAA